MDKSVILPVLYSQPIAERLSLPNRADLLPKIESGEVEHLDFRARVFGTGPIHNPVEFRDEDLPAFARSFAGQPFLRNHEQHDIEARDGTILESVLEGGEIVQDIRLTTRRGMIDYLEGRIDRFSVGWDYSEAICTICNSSFYSSACQHWPGMKYQTADGEKECKILFIEPVGVETSAVNVPAVENTGIVAALAHKQTILGLTAVDEQTSNGQAPDEHANAAQARRDLARAIALAEISPIRGDTIMNLREMLAQRATALAAARALTELVDAESRDFSEAEREQFESNLAEAETLNAKIQTIQAERARLNAAQSALGEFAQADAEKPAPAAAPTVLKRAEFEKLSQVDRLAFVRSGGKIED